MTERSMEELGTDKDKGAHKRVSWKKRCEKKEEELADCVDTLKRLQAEFENYKKRIIREQSQFLEFASQNLIGELLPVLDNFERALAAGECNRDDFLKGIELVCAQFKKVLEKEGLQAIDPLGKHFDPHEHEAMMQVESDEHEEGTVAEVLQKGYLLKGRVIRPAIVKVARKSGEGKE
ncbi:MAG: nucleotide exchange factor GrpE [Actinomycetota bacterium]|nr:nucleotide exchange factor GrpE [Actinomycetota bacterium]